MTGPAGLLRRPRTPFRIVHRTNIRIAPDSDVDKSRRIIRGMIVVSNPERLKANLDKSLCSNAPVIGSPVQAFEMVARGPHLIGAFP
jgi:hypothetical protein